MMVVVHVEVLAVVHIVVVVVHVEVRGVHVEVHVVHDVVEHVGAQQHVQHGIHRRDCHITHHGQGLNCLEVQMVGGFIQK